MFRGTREPGSIDLSRQTRQEVETHIAAGLAHDSHHASGLGRDGLGMLTVIPLPVVTSGTKDDLDASNCDSGHPKRLSFLDGHSMGQRTQTPAQDLTANCVPSNQPLHMQRVLPPGSRTYAKVWRETTGTPRLSWTEAYYEATGDSPEKIMERRRQPGD